MGFLGLAVVEVVDVLVEEFVEDLLLGLVHREGVGDGFAHWLGDVLPVLEFDLDRDVTAMKEGLSTQELDSPQC